MSVGDSLANSLHAASHTCGQVHHFLGNAPLPPSPSLFPPLISMQTRLSRVLFRTESRRFTHTTQGSTIELHEPRPRSQSMICREYTTANKHLNK